MKSALSLVLLLVAMLPGGAAAQTTSKRLFVRAVDRSGLPVTGLTAADFVLVEGGVPRRITRVAPATDPLRIVMLVDNSRSMLAALPDIRRGLVAFFDAVPAPHEIALVTIGNTPVVRQAPTVNREVLKGLAQRLSADGGLVLLGAVFEMYDRFLRKADDKWPILVIVATDGDDGSRGVTEEKFIKVATDMQANDTVVHAVVISPDAKGSGDSVQITLALTKATSGTYESISAASALPEKLTAIAKVTSAQHELSSAQYLLEYDSDSNDPRQTPTLSVTRDGINLTMSRQGRIR